MTQAARDEHTIAGLRLSLAMQTHRPAQVRPVVSGIGSALLQQAGKVLSALKVQDTALRVKVDFAAYQSNL